MAARPRDAIRARQGEDKPLLKIVDAKFLRGPNLHADQSVLVATVTGGEELAALSLPLVAGLGRLTGCEALPGGAELAELVADAREDLPEEADGWAMLFALADRALANHVLVPARGGSLSLGEGEADVFIPADGPKAAEAALRIGITVALAMYGARGRAGVEWMIGRYRELADVIVAQALDLSTLAIARRAIELDIPVYRVSPMMIMMQLGQGVHLRLLTETVPDPQSHHANRLTRDKWTTGYRLKAFGLPVLRSHLVLDAEQAVEAARLLGRPVVVKPGAGGKGLGISLGLTTEQQVHNAYGIAARYGRDVLVESQAPGDDHRLTVVDGRMIAAARRMPATVTGDGVRTVRQLIEALNTDPRRGEGYLKLMVKVPIDARLETLLGQENLSLDAVPAAGRVVKCSLAGNISQGGTAIDVTDLVHPDNRLAAELAARACHALVAGVDFMSSDISKSWREGDGWVLEVNTSPGLRPHWIANPAQDVVTPILRVAFPEGAPARVPTAGITGSMGKSTTCQMLAQIARTAGRHPGVSTTQGIWSGDVQLKQNDWAGGSSAVDLLSDPLVDISIAELARGGLLKKGMVLDAVDVAAVLNVGDNHVGIDGIESREDLARIKSIPVRHARRWVFLNADDPLVLAMREHAKPGVGIALVSTDPKNTDLAAHRAAGGCTVALEGSKGKTRIVVREGDDVVLEQLLSSIPASDLMPAAAIAANAMFASGIALKLGLTAEDVAAGLSTFTSSEMQNPGRHNRVEGLPFELLLTWVDGTPPMQELIGRLDKQKRPAGKRHLFLTVVGNRSDEWSIEMGRTAAGHFDHYWCSELTDRRGREEGEMAELLARGLGEGGVPEEAITRLGGETRGVGHVLGQIEPGDRVTMIVFETSRAFKEIEAFRASLAGQT